MALDWDAERDSGCWAAEAGQANSQLAAGLLRERCVMGCLVYVKIYFHKDTDPHQ